MVLEAAPRVDALLGRLGRDALQAPEMLEAMELCVSCKACRRECPTGVDMARMKVEFLHHYRARHGLRTKDRLVAYLRENNQIGISRAQLARVLKAEGLRWYQEKSYFTERPDPQFVEKRGPS